MKNNKGQALVEFVIILPVFLLLIISVVDFGNIIIKKYSLENDIDVLSEMYVSKNYEEINKYVNDKNIKIAYSNENDLYKITLSKDVNIISPMLNIVFGKAYEVSTEKSIYKNE